MKTFKLYCGLCNFNDFSLLSPSANTRTSNHFFCHPEDPSGSYEMWAQQFQEAYPYITLELKDTTQISYDMRFAGRCFYGIPI